jgi:general L-amino acid transport system permease protein
VGIIGSFPIGILLALGRRSNLPAIRTFCILFIELWRAVPLITVLFMASVILPLFMPQGTSIDKLLRAMVGLTLFYSAYVAEVVRGGLQALPRGQTEAASSLGLNYWKAMVFIILPQALTMVIPGLVGTFISLLKDTALVAIIGLFDLLNAVQAINADVEWKGPTTAFTTYAFAALAYFVLCYAIASYSLYVEKRLSVSRRR